MVALDCLCLNSFLGLLLGPVLDSFWGPFWIRFGTRFWIHFGPPFWGPVLGSVNKKQEACPQFGSNFGPRLGSHFGGSFWEPILSIFFLLGCWLLNIVVLGFRSLGCQAFGKSNLFKSKMVFAQVVRRKGRRISVELFHSQWLQACFVLPSLAATVCPRQWDVMQLSPAQALTISCQSCGVQIAQSELRDTYGRSFVIKELAKFNQDCSSLFPQDSKIVRLQGWPRSSRSLALSPLMPRNINSVPSASSAQPRNGKHN